MSESCEKRFPQETYKVYLKGEEHVWCRDAYHIYDEDTGKFLVANSPKSNYVFIGEKVYPLMWDDKAKKWFYEVEDD